MQAAALFGYAKTELLNRKVNIIMPIIYGDHHDKFLEDFLHSLEGRILNKERLLMGRTKNGYIFPHQNYTRVRRVDSINNFHLSF
jgi:hypothetical protein